jgi:hypothetical protein
VRPAAALSPTLSLSRPLPARALAWGQRCTERTLRPLDLPDEKAHANLQGDIE